jgi:hypothetical protein
VRKRKEKEMNEVEMHSNLCLSYNVNGKCFKLKNETVKIQRMCSHVSVIETVKFPSLIPIQITSE